MEQTLVFLVLATTLALFVYDRFRYEAVALAALLILVLGGVIAPTDAFLGFGHPAVVTVAAVLVITRGLANAGVADWMARPLGRLGGHPILLLAALTVLVMVLSAFINNVGALALFMPVAIALARRHKLPVSLLLMPMAFASLLGGLQTAIGTPPNLIVSEYRTHGYGEAFALFDFAPVGVTIAVAGVLFLVLLGWRLLPHRRGADAGDLSFQLSGYMTEIRVPSDSTGEMLSLRELEERLGPDVQVLGLMRAEEPVVVRRRNLRVRPGDVLTVHGKATDLKEAVAKLGYEMAGRVDESPRDVQQEEGAKAEGAKAEGLYLAETVVLPGAWAVGRSARTMDMRVRFGLNLLGISRQGSPVTGGLSGVLWRSGDVLLLEGDRVQLPDVLAVLGCLPLAARDLSLGRPRKLLVAVGLLGSAVGVAAAGWVPIHIGFVACALAMAVTGMFSAREAYSAVDWPIILLLAAMIPLGAAMESSGAAAWIANLLIGLSTGYSPVVGLAIVLVTTMCLSDIVNNAAAAVLMCPIAAGLAIGLGVSADPFLMAVAVGASCAFLTPVGHQSNTLVMGPGGYRFGDYWRMGLPIEIIVGLIAVWMIPQVWPF